MLAYTKLFQIDPGVCCMLAVWLAVPYEVAKYGGPHGTSKISL